MTKKRITMTNATDDDIEHVIACHGPLVDALEALFKECAMTHKHWGENDNTREANAAIAAGQAALTLAKGA